MKCEICKKKLPSLLRLMHTCRCGKVVCSVHKSETAHNCTFNWKSYGKEVLVDKLNANSLERNSRLQKI